MYETIIVSFKNNYSKKMETRLDGKNGEKSADFFEKIFTRLPRKKIFFSATLSPAFYTFELVYTLV